jgi:hypothetical protein
MDGFSGGPKISDIPERITVAHTALPVVMSDLLIVGGDPPGACSRQSLCP